MKWWQFWKWFKKPVDRRVPAQNQRRYDEESNETARRNEGAHRKFKRVAAVRGHTNSSSGCSTYPVVMPDDFPDRPEKVLARREYDVCGYVIGLVKYLVDIESFSMAFKEFLRDGIGRSGVAKLLKKWKPDLVIAFHKNSVGRSMVEGLEFLVHEKWQDTWFEWEVRRFIRLYIYFVGPTPLRHDNGIKWCDEDTRGGTNLVYYERAAPTILVEPGFVGGKTKTAQALLEGDGLENYSKAISHFCLGYDVINGELVGTES